ncbi:MAG TPA: two-component regulator propeller domain-containing protein [Agriterribacter sp.]|nr:two-component regulator propeller domain-containing protein [Agriterribacter sp.]
MPSPLSKLPFYLLLLVSLCWNRVTAQTGSGYETISTAQGLSQGMIFDLLQDKEGFIWVATKNGLNRYDGYSFKVFSNDPYNPHSLSSNTIRKLFEDSKGRIWVGTEDAGINVYDKKSGNFYRIQHRAADTTSLSGDAIRCIAELANGKMLVSAYGAGFNMIELPAGFFEKPSVPLITRFTLPHNNDNVYAMGKDPAGNMWIGGFDGSVYRFDTAENRLIALNKGHLLNDGFITGGGDVLISGNYFLWDGMVTCPIFDTAKMPAGNILLKPRSFLWRNYYRELSSYDITNRNTGKPLAGDPKIPGNVMVMFHYMVGFSGLWLAQICCRRQ